MTTFYTSVSCLGDKILFRGIRNGKRVQERIPFSPVLFIDTSKGATPYKNVQGEYVGKVNFNTITNAKEFVQKYKGVENFPIYGNQNWEYCFIAQTFPGEINWNFSDIRVANLDIEVGSENGFPDVINASEPITAITVKMSGKFVAFGCGEYNAPDHVTYVKCKDEIDLINRFLDYWSNNYPDAMTGWYIKFFDIPYLINRITKLLGDKEAKRLSPWGFFYKRETLLMGKTQTAYVLSGIATLDYLELFRKFDPSGAAQENYKLDFICSEILGEKKLSYAEYGTLHLLYKMDFQKFMDYNIRDVELVDKLDAKLKLLELAFTLAYDSKSNFDDVFMQTRMWDNIVYNFLWAKGIVMPEMNFVAKTPFAGAYVKEPILGKHKWVVSFDLTSLYPHLMMQYNLSPDTIIDQETMPDCALKEFLYQSISVETLLTKRVDTYSLQQDRVTVTPNGQLFTTSHEGFMPEILTKMFSERNAYKKKMLAAKRKLEEATQKGLPIQEIEYEIAKYNNLQLVKKICLNSCYGALGNEYFRFFDVRIAEAVTMAGQLSIRWIIGAVNKYLNTLLETKDHDYVIASDTDSIYLALGGLVDKVYKKTEKSILPPTNEIITFLDKVCSTHIQPFIDKSYQELATYTNAYAQKMIMKREKLMDVGICIAGKNYIWNIWDDEGIRYTKPIIKAVGLKMIKSNTPEAARKKLKTILQLIVDDKEEELQAFVAKFKQEFRNLPLEDIATPTGMKGLKEYSDGKTIYKKGTSIHIKGSLLYNARLRELKLDRKYPLIHDGEKIKYTYLRMPNPLKNEVISFPTMLPEELGLHNFVDYERQFAGAFLAPLNAVLDVIGWHAEEQASLEDFFS